MRSATALILLMLSVICQAEGLGLMTINTEWFWDENPPHEGHIAFGPAGNPPTTKQVELEAYGIAQVLLRADADLVALTEVEGETAATRILNYLPSDWSLTFDKGRDSATGQDVAILHRLSLVDGSVTDFPNAYGTYEGQRKRPSKIMGAAFEHEGETIYVIAAHLISKRASNDKARAAQATAIRGEIERLAGSYEHIVVMGDLNDTLDSTAVQIITGTNSPVLRSFADSKDWSYEYDGDRELIDHILVTDGISSNDLLAIDLGPISDHRAVFMEATIDNR